MAKYVLKNRFVDAIALSDLAQAVLDDQLRTRMPPWVWALNHNETIQLNLNLLGQPGSVELNGTTCSIENGLLIRGINRHGSHYHDLVSREHFESLYEAVE